MSTISNHLMYLEEMVRILSSISRGEEDMDMAEPIQPIEGVENIESIIEPVEAVERMPSHPPVLLRSQPYGLLGQMLSNTVREYFLNQFGHVQHILEEFIPEIDIQFETEIDNFDINFFDFTDDVNERKQNRPYSDEDVLRVGEFVESSSSSYTDDCCSICLDAFANSDKYLRTVCGHTFHPQCIHTWLNTKTNCPVCRRGFN